MATLPHEHPFPEPLLLHTPDSPLLFGPAGIDPGWRAFDSRRGPMALSQQAVDARVDCTVRVARDADGTLADGAETQLARVDGVEVVDPVDVAGLEPRLNDLAVDVEARVRVDGVGAEPPEEEVRQRLADGFGVDVSEVEVQR